MLCVQGVLLCSGPAQAAGPAVSVFPIPNGQLAAPQTQITFRGVPASDIGPIVVSGSRSGVHSGTIQPDSDGDGGSFLPSTRFTSGEVVTVQTSLNILGATNGTFRFTVATPAGIPAPSFHWPVASRSRGDVQTFPSRRDLVPDTLHVTVRQKPGVYRGDIFVAPQYGPVQDGPMIFDPYGNLLWFKPLSGVNSASDFRVQTYQGQPVLTWWQGDVWAGIGLGTDVIYNTAYRQIAVVRGGNGLQADQHEFQLTPQGTALITSYFPVWWNARSVHGPSRQIVFDSVVQEIDIPTGLVLFQWDSLDHVPLTDSYSKVPAVARHPFDYFHVNSIALDDDGALIISGRATWAGYKIDHQTAATIWQLGGKRSTFKLARGTSWVEQHDVRPRARNDAYITLFDDGGGPPQVHNSRGLKLKLDLKGRTARSVGSFAHLPGIPSGWEGNIQQLPNFNLFVGWGQQPWITEYSSRGSVLFDARFVADTPSYRAYRFPWSGSPATLPAIAVSRRGRSATVYVSWNGATHVKSWRVLGGSSATALHTLRTAGKSGFETSIAVPAQTYVAVQALDYGGHLMSTSRVLRSR